VSRSEDRSIVDASSLRMREATIVTGLWLTFLLAGLGELYVALTWERPNRPALAVLFGVAVLAGIGGWQLPRERLVRSRYREAFFLSWSFLDFALIVLGTLADGGTASPLVLIFFVPVVFSSMSYPLGSVVAVGVLSIVSYLALAATVGGSSASYQAVFATVLACTGAMSALQARNHNRQREALAAVSRAVADGARSLEAKVAERTRELDEARAETLHRLAVAAEYRDDDTFHHTQRVGTSSAEIAACLGLSAEQIRLLREAAPLHDVGKIAIPDRILLKPGTLGPQEYEVMKTHATLGARLLAGSSSSVLQMATVIAESHHERWDGAGYPNRLAREAIPLVGRVVAVADVFDALTHDRPYKSAWSVEQAVAEIQSAAGSQFDPRVVAAFLTIHNGVAVATDTSKPQEPPRTIVAPRPGRSTSSHRAGIPV
jgi:HD-GYP domain-containing protein (c-di-GMP phosphodiesterase class II)